MSLSTSVSFVLVGTVCGSTTLAVPTDLVTGNPLHKRDFNYSPSCWLNTECDKRSILSSHTSFPVVWEFYVLPWLTTYLMMAIPHWVLEKKCLFFSASFVDPGFTSYRDTEKITPSRVDFCTFLDRSILPNFELLALFGVSILPNLDLARSIFCFRLEVGLGVLECKWVWVKWFLKCHLK